MSFEDKFFAGVIGTSFLIGVIGIPLIISVGIIGNYKSKEYTPKVEELCVRTTNRFDANKNGILETNERVEMIRGLGYNITLPTEDTIVYLTPGEYNNKAVLVLSSSDDVGSLKGIVSRGNEQPTYYKTIGIPLSKLEEINSER